MVSFIVQKLLVRYNLIYFCFCCLCLRRQIQKTLLRLTSRSLLHLFFSSSFIVLGLTFKSLFHLEFFFFEKMIQFISFSCSCPVFPTPMTEEFVFSALYILASFVIDYLPIYVWVHFWALYSVPLIYVSIFVPLSYCFDYYNLKSESVLPPALFFLKIALAILVPFKFTIISSTYVKNATGILIGIALNL